MKWILYATDGSDGALAAGRFLAGLPCSPDIHVHVLTAATPDAASGDCEDILAAAVRAMGRFPGRVTTATAPAESTCETIAAIVNVASNIGADLIVVGSRGLSGLSRIILGSVAAGVSRNATCPVLVAREPSEPVRTVVVGLDGGDTGDKALSWAIREFPLEPDCGLILVRAVEPVTAGVGAPKEKRIRPELRAETSLRREPLDEIRCEGERLAMDVRRKTGYSAAFVLGEGEPTKALIATAMDHDAGLIVTGSRGLVGVQALLRGSVSEDLLYEAPCSVLIVRETHDA